MKKIIHRITLAAALAFAGFLAIPDANATDLTLDGYGYYSLGSRVSYRSSGASQSGRYRNLGADYYHNAEIGMDAITSRSSNRSGDMSFELWAMRYYDSTSGIVLMTRGVGYLRGYYSYRNIYRSGQAVSLDSYRYPETNLWEFTVNGWKFRDALKFPYTEWL